MNGPLCRDSQHDWARNELLTVPLSPELARYIARDLPVSEDTTHRGDLPMISLVPTCQRVAAQAVDFPWPVRN